MYLNQTFSHRQSSYSVYRNSKYNQTYIGAVSAFGWTKVWRGGSTTAAEAASLHQQAKSQGRYAIPYLAADTKHLHWGNNNVNSLTKDQCGSGTKLSFLNHVELLPDTAILPVSSSYTTSEQLYMFPGERNIDTKVDVDAAHAPQESRSSGPSPLPFTVVKCDIASQHISKTTQSLGQNNFVDIVSVNSHDAIIQHKHDLHVLYANPSALNAKPRDFGATSVATLDGYTAVLYTDGSVRLYNLTFHPIKWPVGMNGNLGWETDRVIPDNRCGLRTNVIPISRNTG